MSEKQLMMGGVIIKRKASLAISFEIALMQTAVI